MEVWAEEGQSLGLSIVGGRHVIKRLRNGEELKGIFIKQVLPNSPADKTCLKTGDKILEVLLGLLPGSIYKIHACAFQFCGCKCTVHGNLTQLSASEEKITWI